MKSVFQYVVGKCKTKKPGKVGFVVKKFLSSNSTVFFLDYMMFVTEMATKMKIASFTTMHRGSFKIAH